MASLFSQDKVHHPTASNMRSWSSAVLKEFDVGAASVFESIG
jgi:hypothetical protein